MSRIEQLIAELCPDGVEWKELGGIVNIQRGVRVVRNQLLENGKYPVYQNSLKPLGYFEKSNCKANTTFIISAGAAGDIGYSDIDFWAADDCFLCLCPNHLESKYLYYVLQYYQTLLYSRVRRASVPRLSRDVVEKLRIPLPPLPIQQEIVRILDTFTDLDAELQAELEARKKQYEHYRNQLLNFEGKEVEWKTLGEVCDTVTDYVAGGSFAELAKRVKYDRCENYAQLIRTTDLKNKFKGSDFVYVDKDAFNFLWRVKLDKSSIILPNVGNCGEVYFVTNETLPYKNNVLGPNSILVRSSTNDIKFLSYLFQSEDFQVKLKKITSPVGQTKFNKTELKKLAIPIPPLPIQQEIVSILDTFTDLDAKLQAELEARRKQYEYYREKLLTFERAEKFN